MSNKKEMPKQTFAKKLKKGENSLCREAISWQSKVEMFMMCT
jgi:hypothetical protein